MSARVEVRFGPPLDPAKFSAGNGDDNVAEEFTREILKCIARLAERPDFGPRLAGRNWKPTTEELAAAMDAKDRRDEAERLAGPNGSAMKSQGTGVRGQESGVAGQ